MRASRKDCSTMKREPELFRTRPIAAGRPDR
jgi:hypothetical protein